MKNGRPHGYDSARLPEILASVVHSKGSLGQVADLNKIHRDTFYGWIRSGQDDQNKGLSTDLAHFSSELKKKQAEVILGVVEDAYGDYQKAKFIIWWLGKISREDFGDDSEELKQLKQMVFNQILPLIGKGEFHGKKEGQEVDSESDSEES